MRGDEEEGIYGCYLVFDGEELKSVLTGTIHDGGWHGNYIQEQDCFRDILLRDGGAF